MQKKQNKHDNDTKRENREVSPLLNMFLSVAYDTVYDICTMFGYTFDNQSLSKKESAMKNASFTSLSSVNK